MLKNKTNLVIYCQHFIDFVLFVYVRHQLINLGNDWNLNEWIKY